MKQQRRNKIPKSVLCIALAGILLLNTACGAGGNSGSANASEPIGRYVETDVTPPIDGRFASFLASDGTIVCFDRGLDTRYDSADGGISWVESPGPGRNNDRYQNVSIGTLLPDGNLLVYIQGEGVAIVAPDGSSEPFPVADIDKAMGDGEVAFVSLIKFLGADRLLISYVIGGMMIQGGGPAEPAAQGGGPAEPTAQGGSEEPETQGGSEEPGGQGSPRQMQSTQRSYASSIDMVNKTLLLEISSGKQIAELPVESVMAAAADDENVYYMDMQGNVKAFSLADGSPDDKVSADFGGGSGAEAMLSMMDSGGDVLAVSEDGSLYALFNRSLLMRGADGSISNVLEGTAYSIGSPSSTAESVFSLPDGAIIVNMLDSMQANRLYRYVWDENAEINPDKTLSVWSLEENAFVRAAIAELRKKNPDSYITYEVAMGGDNAVSASDAIKTLNTRLIGGSGPDIVILDGCPEESYAGKGMLLDLAGLVDTGDIYQNLLSPYISEGKMYCLPTQFIMPALMGSDEDIGKAQTLEDLVRIVVNGNDTTVGSPGAGPFTGVPEDERAELYFEDLEELWDIMWLSAAPAIIDDNRLETGDLERLLEAIKAISDKLGLGDPGSGNRMGMGVAFSSGGMVTALPSSLVRYTSQITNYGAFAAGNLMLLQLMMEREGSGLAPFPGLVPGAWRPSTVAGISADTSVPDFAVELIRTMLSIEVQRINYGAGLPVTRSGISEQVKEINERMADNDLGTFDIDMDAIIDKLSERSVDDTVLTDMMWGSVEKLCMGSIDVGGAVKEIEQNIKNYLAERV